RIKTEIIGEATCLRDYQSAANFSRDRGAAMKSVASFATRKGPTQTSSPFYGCSEHARSAAGVAADDWQHLAGDVARAGRRREKNKGGRISSGCAGRRIGVSAPNVSTALAGLSAGLSGVHTGPGATTLTRMPRSTRWVARERAKA